MYEVDEEEWVRQSEAIIGRMLAEQYIRDTSIVAADSPAYVPVPPAPEERDTIDSVPNERQS